MVDPEFRKACDVLLSRFVGALQEFSATVGLPDITQDSQIQTAILTFAAGMAQTIHMRENGFDDIR